MTGPRLFIDIRPLRSNRAFRNLWIGSSLAGLGQQVSKIAVLAQVWDMTRSPLWTGLIGLSIAVPMITFGLLGGVLTDMVNRRTVVCAATAGQLVSAVALCAQAVFDNESALLLLGLVAVQAAFGALGAPARRTFPVRLLPPDQVAAGLALQNVAFQVAMLVGPVLGGLAVAGWSYSAAYGAEAVAFAVSFGAVLAMPSMQPLASEHRPTGSRRPARGGWSIILRRPTLWGSFAVDLSQTVLAMPIALFPVINELRFGGDPRTLGLFFSAIAVGGIGAGLLSGTVNRWQRGGQVQLVAAFTWGVALLAFGLADSLWAALIFLAAAGAADTVSVITRGALVQLETPDEYRGRVSSVEHVVGAGAPEVGNFRAGALASVVSAPMVLVIGGVTAAVGVCVVAAVNPTLRAYRWPRRTDQPQGPVEVVGEQESERG